MPKKTAHSRSGAQRSSAKKKSFELVRPVSDENVLETVERSETVDEVEEAEVEAAQTEVVEVKSAPEPVLASSGSKSAAARMAARRQAAQRTQRPQASLIVAENYGYVRHDLIFILVLAIVMFSAIIIMHFIPAIGG